jgi:predicted DNA-binding transcriptional regulator AlpA
MCHPVGGRPMNQTPIPTRQFAASCTQTELMTQIQVQRLLAVGRATLWRIRRRDPSFPKPISISIGARRFIKSEVIAWLEARR